MKKILLWLPFAALLFMSACGEEIGRLPINEISSEFNTIEESITLPFEVGEKVKLWADMDMQYEGEAKMVFNITLMLEDEVIDQLQLDPRDKKITIGEVQTNINGKVDWKFSGQMGEFEVPETGNYTFIASFYASENVSIDKAEMFIKK